MGTFTVTAELGDMEGRNSERLELLVDTGSSYSFIPRPILERLGIRVTGQRPFRLANEERVFYDVGRAMVRVDGVEEVTLIVFGEPDVMPLMGTHALEGLGLVVDPANQRLVPVDALLKAAAL